MELFENYRMYARHTLLLSESESRAYARGYADRTEGTAHDDNFRSFQLDYDRGYQHASDDLSGR